MAEGAEEMIEEDLRLALLVAGECRNEVEEGREERLGFEGGHAAWGLSGMREGVNAGERGAVM